MSLFNLSLTDKVSQMALYNGIITTELPDGDSANVWKNMFKLFHAKNINKMSELKSEFVKSTLYLKIPILMNGLQSYTSSVGT
jgi:hypothetical protein